MDTENGCGITEMQRKVASAMMTCGEDETLGDVLGRSGVTAEEYAAWLEDGRFTGYLAEAAYRAVEAAAPRVATALARVAQSNVQAMKLYFDILCIIIVLLCIEVVLIKILNLLKVIAYG